MKYCVDYLIFLFIDFFCKRVCGKGDNVKFKNLVLMFNVFFVRNKIIENFMICIDNLNDDVNSIKYIINILIEFRVIL